MSETLKRIEEQLHPTVTKAEQDVVKLARSLTDLLEGLDDYWITLPVTRLRAEVQASIRMNKLLVNENKRLKEREAYCTDPHCLVCDQTRYFVRPHERLREGDK